MSLLSDNPNVEKHEDNYSPSNLVSGDIVLQDWRVEEFPYRIHKLCEHAEKVLLTGSAYICKGLGVKPNDIDIMVLVDNYDSFIKTHLSKAEPCGDQESQNSFKFRAYRDGLFNILVTDSEIYFDRWALATHIAKQLKLTNKQDRVILFGYIRSDLRVISPDF